MAFGDNESAVTLAVLYFFESFLSLWAVHDVFKGILFDVTDNPFFARAVARRYITPRVDEEEVGKCTASRAITGIVAA